MQFITEPNQLTIQLEGFEKLWALKARLQIPHYAILELDYLAQQPTVRDFKGFLRLPGTSFPWRFLAGSYRQKKGREFWYVQMKQPGLLIITLKPCALDYDKIRLTCSPEVAQSVADWWQGHK